jgi:hypothetical protein
MVLGVDGDLRRPGKAGRICGKPFRMRTLRLGYEAEAKPAISALNDRVGHGLSHSVIGVGPPEWRLCASLAAALDTRVLAHDMYEPRLDLTVGWLSEWVDLSIVVKRP